MNAVFCSGVKLLLGLSDEGFLFTAAALCCSQDYMLCCFCLGDYPSTANLRAVSIKVDLCIKQVCKSVCWNPPLPLQFSTWGMMFMRLIVTEREVSDFPQIPCV